MKPHSYSAAIISVAAGKGGTGKTLLASSLALMLHQAYPGRVQLLDCDVEEPNAHLLLHPYWEAQESVAVPVPSVNLQACTRCGQCAVVCQSSAIAVIRQAVLTYSELCSGCGACAFICPLQAITEMPHTVGLVRHGRTPEGIVLHAGILNVGHQKATPVTRALKKSVRPDRISIIDAPPGTACPMQEAIEGSDYCVLVTEPTPFGLSDLQAAVATCRGLNIPCGIVINRYGSGFTSVEDYCAREGLTLLGCIPHERRIAEAYSRGEAILARKPQWQRALLNILATIFREIAKNKNKE